MMKSVLTGSRKHDISFHPTGKIDISARIARQLSLAPGDVIDIIHESNELYLCVKLRAGQYAGRHEGTICATNHGKGTSRIWSKALTDAVLRMAGTSGILRCPCGAEFERDNKKYITIIYRCAL